MQEPNNNNTEVKTLIEWKEAMADFKQNRTEYTTKEDEDLAKVYDPTFVSASGSEFNLDMVCHLLVNIADEVEKLANMEECDEDAKQLALLDQADSIAEIALELQGV